MAEAEVKLTGNLDLSGTPTERPVDYIDLRTTFPYRPTLFIGLGGTGAQAVSKIKSLLSGVFASARTNEQGVQGDIPSCFQFRAFDTCNAEHPKNLAKDAEWFPSGIKNVKAALDGAKGDPFYEGWLPEGIDDQALTQGVGGRRALGRFAFATNIAQFHAAIGAATAAMAAPNIRCVDTRPKIYIFSSLTGGTGSGALLDTAFYLANNAHVDSEVIGIVGFMEGLSSGMEQIREKARVGTFSALKELQAFMEGRPSETGVQAGDMLQFPGGTVRGRYRRPFTHCFLISEHNAAHQVVLPQAMHVSSFMARVAYMMCTSHMGQAKDGTRDFWGAFDDIKDLVPDVYKGASHQFLVPSLVQVHLPVRETVDLIVLMATANTLRYLAGGRRYDGDKESQEFVDLNGLGSHHLIDSVAKSTQGEPVVAKRWDALIQSRLSDKKTKGQDIVGTLRFGDDMGEKRRADLVSVWSANVQRLRTNAGVYLRQEVEKMLKNDAFLYHGALDFLQDLVACFDNERKLLEYRVARDRDAYDAIKKEWLGRRDVIKKYAESKGFWGGLGQPNPVEVIGLYVDFLNRADILVTERAKCDSAMAILREVRTEANDLACRLKAVYESTVQGAIELLNERITAIASSLHEQESGQLGTVDGICSFNVLSQEVREQEVSQFPARTIIEMAAASGWSPMQWLEMPVEGKSAQTTSVSIATGLIARVDRMAESLRTRSVAEWIAGCKDMRGNTPAEALASILLGQAQAQATIGDHQRLGRMPQMMGVVAGLTKDLMTEVEKTSHGSAFKSRFHRTETFEANRITFLGVSTPVALAGIANIRAVHEQTYNRWMQERESGSKGADARRNQNRDKSLYHCYPGSDKWASPTQYTEAVGTEGVFAKALGLSEMIAFSEFETESAIEANTTDKEVLDKKTKNPKEKRYGLFRYGKGNLWLTPFFTPGRAAVELQGELTNLGANLAEAAHLLDTTSEVRKTARAWVNWFEKNWQEHFSEAEMRAKIEHAIAVLSQVYDREHAGDSKRVWDAVKRHLTDWLSDFS